MGKRNETFPLCPGISTYPTGSSVLFGRRLVSDLGPGTGSGL